MTNGSMRINFSPPKKNRLKVCRMSRALVKTIFMPIKDDVGKNLYKVEYIAKYGDGCTCGNVVRTFGVYDDEKIANFIVYLINNGQIRP